MPREAGGSGNARSWWSLAIVAGRQAVLPTVRDLPAGRNGRRSILGEREPAVAGSTNSRWPTGANGGILQKTLARPGAVGEAGPDRGAAQRPAAPLPGAHRAGAGGTGEPDGGGPGEGRSAVE